MNDLKSNENIAPFQESLYDQLHALAEKALRRETPGHSLQPTMIVNDAYLRLLEQRNIDQAYRTQVMAAGAKIIRRLLIDYTRKRKRQKRGGSEKNNSRCTFWSRMFR